MKGLERIKEMRRRHDEVRQQMAAKAIQSAQMLADAVGQDMDFEVQTGNTDLPQLKGRIARDGDGLFVWLVNPAGDHVPHSAWGYDQAKQYATGVAALIEHIGDELERMVKGEEGHLGKVTDLEEDDEVVLAEADFPDSFHSLMSGDGLPSDSIAQQIANDESLISALAHSSDSIPTSFARSRVGPMPEALECMECKAFFTPKDVFDMTSQGTVALPSACPKCGKVGALLPAIA